jgi:UDP-GlcNAc:undecaprenyl-phosphate GlcNAc-1-phosphate transferase
MREYLLCAFAAAAITYLMTNPVRLGAIRLGAMAEVRDRDVHAVPVPRWGGLAMMIGLLVGVVLASQLPLLSGVFADAQLVWALLEGCLIIVVIGMLDDRYGLDAATKLAGQVLAAGVMAVQGISLIWLPIGGVLALDRGASILLTVFVIVVTINAVNFVDGLDGLAAGIVGIAALAFFAYSYNLSVSNGFDRATVATLISVLLVGLCVGFLPHNFYPARIFMGDTGSMLIGLLLAASTITLTGQVDPNAINDQNLAPVLLPLLLPVAVVAIPLVDLLLAVVRRTRAGRSPFAPDKEHLHHRLLERGHSQRRAAAIMYTWSAAIACAVLATALVSGPLYVAVIVGLVVITFAVTINIPSLRVGGRPLPPAVSPLADATVPTEDRP